MVLISSHRACMGDAKSGSERLGPLSGKRGAHLQRLKVLEDLIRERAPMPASYDITRMQPPFFHEFAYTEMLGGVWICPQSSELTARVVQAAFEDPAEGDLDAAAAILSTARDKYDLDAPKGALPRRVAFLPGSNIFEPAVSREALTRAMHSDPDLVIKPHPLTNEETLRKLGQLYGYHRIVEPTASGYAYLSAADEILVTSASEMGLHALLLGKPILNITKTSFEARSTFGPIYRLLWGKAPEAAKATLQHILRAPAAGFVHPEDSDPQSRLEAFFALSLRLREPFRPLVIEYDTVDYAAMVMGGGQRGV